MVIFLCGFMGSGKSTLFNRLQAASPEIDGIDLDHEILQKFGRDHKSLGELIDDLGLEVFRQMETGLLLDYCRKKGDWLISLGGGALSLENLSAIKSSATTSLVWLDTPFEECWRRIEGDTNRPLVRKGRTELQRLYRERLSLYREAKARLDPKQQNEIKNFQELKVVCEKAMEN